MRLAVLGTLVFDTIWRPGAVRPVEQWGGIAYSLAALAATCPPGWEIVPLVKVGEDLADDALRFLEQVIRITPGDGVRIVPDANNRVELRYYDAAERTERLSGGVAPWSTPELEFALTGVDALYVNFISGREMSLETAEALAATGIPLYADIHSLCLGPPTDGPRIPRRPPHVERWLAAFDAVQMNTGERRLLAGPVEEEDDWLAGLIRTGRMLAVVTAGAEGVAYAARENAENPRRWPALRAGSRRSGEASLPSAIRRGRIPSPSGMLAGDPTGCGDIWGATMYAGLLAGLSTEAAMSRASIAAAARLQTRRIEDLPDAIRIALTLQPEPPTSG